jgi:prolyl-tRNA synthetase
MRWSQAFIPTLRDDPAGAEAISHKLLVRGGYIRQLAAGHYTMLPLGQLVRRKVAQIIREEMNRIGGQEMFLPALHPAEIWQKSGRWYDIADDMFRLKDRKDVDHVLGMTHEEIFAMLSTELFSYRELPQIWYQLQTKFRDEPRPKSGLLRVREFTMKDSYTLDIDEPGLDSGFDKHYRAYFRIFHRLGLDPVDVTASSGIMGDGDSIEFMIRSEAGEDWIITCGNCDYRANVETAISALAVIDDGGEAALERLSTPGLTTIKALADAHPEVAAPERQIKTLVYYLEKEPILLLLRGDHDLQEQKLKDTLRSEAVRPAQPEEIRELLGAGPGSLGAVGVEGRRVIADHALRDRSNMVTGANEDDWHLTGVDLDRDVSVTEWADLRAVGGGESCSVCGGELERWKGVEVGHIFKLGTKYTKAFDAFVQDEEGISHPIIMGSYGIGVERAMATIVESNHDEQGIIWPVSVAPYEVLVAVIRGDDASAADAAESIYGELGARGVSVLLDDRDERPGVKFADAELIGIPYRVVVGPRGIESGTVEVVERRELRKREVAVDEVVEELATLVSAARPGVGVNPGSDL